MAQHATVGLPNLSLRFDKIIYTTSNLCKEFKCGDLLKEELDEALNDTPDVVLIKSNLFNEEYMAIVDTGSQMSIISEHLFNQLMNKNNNEIKSIPVQNLYIMGITGIRNRKVNKQVYLNLCISNVEFQTLFIVVKDIHVNLLLGVDFLELYKGVIDIENKLCKFINGSKTVITEIVSQELRQAEKISWCNCMQFGDDELWEMKSNEVLLFKEGIESGVADVYCQNGRTQKSVIYGDPKVDTENDNILVENCKLNIANDVYLPPKLCSSDDVVRFHQLLCRYRHIFSDKPGKVSNYKMKLLLKDNPVLKSKTYPIPFSKRIQVNEKIQEMIKDKIIEKSNSQFTNPLVVITKKDNSIRLCLDARELNKNLITDRTCTDEIDEIFKRFHGVKYFTVIDFTAGFWQIELEENSRKYVAFTVEGRNYQFCRMPFGLLNSSAAFIQCVNEILGPDILNFVTVYVDEMIIC